MSLRINAQSPIDNAIAYLQQFNSEEIDLENQMMILNDFIESPLSINQISIEEINKFPLLNQRHFFAIQKHIKYNGAILSIFELKTLPLFNQELCDVIEPFVKFEIEPKKSVYKGFIMHKSSFILQNQKGFTRQDSGKYLGNKTHETTRIKWGNQNLKTFVLWEKDKGEQLNQSYFKFGIEKSYRGKIKQINIGSFSANLGEGLIHSNQTFSSKNSPIESFIKIHPDLRINSSTNESNFENGIGIITQFRSLKSTYFCSFKDIHGNLEENKITSIKSDGLFNTYTELHKRQKGSTQIIGTSQSLNFNQLQISINSVKVHNSIVYAPEDNYYNHNYSFNNFWNNSLSYRYFNGSVLLKGETAFDQYFNLAFTNNFVYNFDNHQLLINTRYFADDYNSFRAQTFSEGSRVQNEKGFFVGFSGSQEKSDYYLSADFFNSPTPKYLVHLPSFGKEFVGFINYQINDSNRLKLFYKYELKQKDESLNKIDILENRIQNRFYIQLKSLLNSELRFIYRLDLNTIKTPNELYKGIATYIDFNYSFQKSKLGVRLTYFDTDNWDSRIYHYENDILYHFSIPALYENGLKYFFNYSIKINKAIQIWAKYSNLYYINKTSIGSGNDEISGNQKSEFRVQAKINF